MNNRELLGTKVSHVDRCDVAAPSASVCSALRYEAKVKYFEFPNDLEEADTGSLVNVLLVATRIPFFLVPNNVLQY